MSQSTATAGGLVIGLGSAATLFLWGIHEWRRKDRCQLLLLILGSTIAILTAPGEHHLVNATLPRP
ncbi:hypothetical protein ACFXGO_31695 [Streptomyces roseus]